MTAPAPTHGVRERTLGYLLADTLRLLRQDFAARARGLDLTPALARLLFQVDREPGACQAELAARLEVTPATLGRMVDRLVARGYLRRSADAGDRRAFRVHLDQAGEAVLGELVRIRLQTEGRATLGFSAEDRARLTEQLARLCDNLTDGRA